MTTPDPNAAEALVSQDVQQQVWAVLNNPATNFARRSPRGAAIGIAEVLARVLIALADTDPNDGAFDLWLLGEVQRHVIATAGLSAPTERTH